MLIVHGQPTDLLPSGQDIFLFTVELYFFIYSASRFVALVLEIGPFVISKKAPATHFAR